MSEPSKEVRVYRLTNTAKLPVYKSSDAAGADLCADIGSQWQIDPGERSLIPTGLILEIPQGYEGQIRPRSGLAAKHGVTVLNSPGTIDADYRGEVKIIIVNLGSSTYRVNPGERIAQLVIAPVEQAYFEEVTDCDLLSATDRGSNGMGSTGS